MTHFFLGTHLLFSTSLPPQCFEASFKAVPTVFEALLALFLVRSAPTHFFTAPPPLGARQLYPPHPIIYNTGRDGGCWYPLVSPKAFLWIFSGDFFYSRLWPVNTCPFRYDPLRCCFPVLVLGSPLSGPVPRDLFCFGLWPSAFIQGWPLMPRCPSSGRCS